MKSFKLGICGLGTVGAGTVNVLQNHLEEINARLGIAIELIQVGARRDNPACDLSGINVTRDIFDVVNNPDVDLVVEVIGGTTVAYDLVMQAIANGKHVVTANKALIAVHGNEIFAAAEQQGVQVAYEAAVAGGIPIIKALREGLSANRVEWLAGIINGTGNFILTEMRDKGRDFADVLKEAQELGYAEADPTFDVEGIDAAHKLVIMASIAFGMPLQFDKTYTEGISKVQPQDVTFAKELGYRIKHLGIARRVGDAVELRVHPTLIPESQLLANVDGVLNAVLVKGDVVGPTLYYGPGAGGDVTASAVMADIIDIARNSTVQHLGCEPQAIRDLPIVPEADISSCHYLRMMVEDKPGTLAQVTGVLGNCGIDIEAVIQKEPHAGDSCVPVVLLTNEVKEQKVRQAVEQLAALGDVKGEVVHLRMDALQ